MTAMDEHLDPRTALSEVDAVRRGVRADLHATSTPLLAVGAALTLLLALLGEPRMSDGPGFLVWLVALPSLFAALSGWERRKAARRGAAGPARAYAVAAVALALLLVVLGVPILWLGGPFLFAGGVLVVLGLRSGRRRLAGWAAALAGAGTAESFYALSNRATSYLPYLHDALLTCVAVLFVVAGLVERRRESR